MKINRKILAVCLGVVVDQIIKIIVIHYQNISIVNNFLNFSYIKNKGMALGIGGNSLFSIIISNLIVLGIVVRFMVTQKNRIDRKTNIALSLILSGGISNLIDRICRSGVVDYIKFETINFPIFNLADIMVVCGFIIFAYALANQTNEVLKQKKIY